MREIIAIVGMAGSGKSVVAQEFKNLGFEVIRFGDATDIYLKDHNLPINEANEKMAREKLRKEHGMAAYAIVNKPRIEASLKDGSVVIDGVYSWEEYKYLKQHYGDAIKFLAIYVSPATRSVRLKIRQLRPLTHEERHARDHAEIENINKAGPIAMADHTIINEGSIEELKAAVRRYAEDKR